MTYFKITLALTIQFFASTLCSQTPMIESISPDSGPAGTVVTINGANFGANPAENTVFFGGIPANVITANSMEITAEVPLGAEYGPIQVITNGLVSYSKSSFIPTFSNGTIIDEFSYTYTTKAYQGGSSVWRAFTKDVDLDGRPDIIADIQGYPLIYLHNGTETESIQFESAVSYGTAGQFINYPSIADINGDGKVDIVYPQPDFIHVRMNNSKESDVDFATIVKISLPDQARVTCAADFDLDGKPDIASTKKSNGISVLRNLSQNDTLQYDTPLVLTAQSAPLDIIAIDFDQDGYPDLAVGNWSSNSVSIFKNVSSESDSINFSSPIHYSVGENPVRMSSADFNGDGLPEIVVSNYESRSISVLRNTTLEVDSLSFNHQLNLTTAAKPLDLSMSDINGDGLVDILLNSGWKISAFSNMTKNSSEIEFDARVDIELNFDPPKTFGGSDVADFNLDGKPDILIEANQQLLIFENTMDPSNFISFEIEGSSSPAKIDRINKTIEVFIPDTASVQPSFEVYENASVFIDGVEQISGVSEIIFSDTIVYNVLNTNSASEWKVFTKNKVLPFFRSFEIESANSPAIIDQIHKTIEVFVPDTASVSPIFEIYQNAAVFVDGEEQISGTSKVVFSDTVVYSIEHDNGFSEWNVFTKHKVLPFFMSFEIESANSPAIIDQIDKTIEVFIPDTTTVSPIFETYQNAAVFVDGVEQISGTSKVVFSDTVVYSIEHDNGFSEWSVFTNIESIPLASNDMEYIMVYPNPFDSTIKVSGAEVSQMKLYDLSGKKIIETDSTIIETQNLNPGKYILHIYLVNGKRYTAKVIK